MKLIALLALITLNVWAAPRSKWFELKNATFGFGSYTEFYDELQIDEAGNKNDFTFNPYLSVGAEGKTLFDLYAYPELILVIPDDGDYGKMTKTTFIFSFEVGQKFFNEKLLLTTGSSIIATNYNGEGGTITLQNGDNQSENFFAPNENRTTINNTLDFGASLFIPSMDLNVKLQTMIFSVFESERTMISYTLSFNYFWGGILETDFFK